MKQNILVHHPIVPVRTAQEQFQVAGVDTHLIATDVQRGIVYVTGIHITSGGAAIMVEAEWQNYLGLCDIWLNSPVDQEGGETRLPPRSHFAASFTEIERLLLAHARCIKEDERDEIARQLAALILPLKEAVLRAEQIYREDNSGRGFSWGKPDAWKDFYNPSLGTPWAGDKKGGTPA